MGVGVRSPLGEGHERGSSRTVFRDGDRCGPGDTHANGGTTTHVRPMFPAALES